MVTRVGKYVGGLGIDATGKLEVTTLANVTVGNGTTTGNVFVGGRIGIGTATPNTKLEIAGGSISRGVPAIKTSTPFTLADSENWIIVNAAAMVTMNIPPASQWYGRELTLKNIQAIPVIANTATIAPISSLTPAANIVTGAGKWATLVSNGTHWVIMATG